MMLLLTLCISWFFLEQKKVIFMLLNALLIVYINKLNKAQEDTR